MFTKQYSGMTEEELTRELSSLEESWLIAGAELQKVEEALVCARQRVAGLVQEREAVESALEVMKQKKEQKAIRLENLEALKEAADKMGSSSRPIVRAVSGVLYEVLSNDEAVEGLGASMLDNITYMYRYPNTLRINVGPRLTVRLFPTNEGSYYIQYFAGDRANLKHCYKNYRPVNPAHQSIDDRYLMVEIDIRKDDPTAFPVVVVKDDEQSITGGLIQVDSYIPAHRDVVKKWASEIIGLLRGGDIHIGNVVIRKDKTEPQQL